MNNRKNSSIELLRIIAMFFIILSHCCVHGIKNEESIFMYNNIIKSIFTLGHLGVDIFVLITGYFSVEKKFKIKKVLLLELITLFYSLSFFLLTSVINCREILLKDIIKSFFPIFFEKYWFMTAYIVLYLFSPFINVFINSTDKKNYKLFILILISLVFIIPTFTTRDFYFNELAQFIALYSIGGYIKKYNDINNKKALIITIISSIIVLLLTILLVIISNYYPSIIKFRTYFLNRNSIFVLLISIGILIIFKNKKAFYNKTINTISSCVLGIYLIHDNPDFRDVLWNKLLNIGKYINKPHLFFILILMTFIIFIVCLIIEFIRQKTIGKINIKLVSLIEKEDLHSKRITE